MNELEQTIKQIILNTESGVQNEERKDDTESKTDDKPKTRKTRKSRKTKKEDDKKADEESDKDNKESKKVSKRRKTTSKKVKKVIKKEVKLPPILESEYKERIRYLTKRIYHCKDENKRKSYRAHLEKLDRRERISC